MVLLKEQFEAALKKARANRKHVKTINKTGFKWVCRAKNSHYKNKYVWVYQRTINNKRYSVSASTLLGLYNKVLAKGWEWIILDVEKAKVSVDFEGVDWNLFQQNMGGC